MIVLITPSEIYIFEAIAYILSTFSIDIPAVTNYRVSLST